MIQKLVIIALISLFTSCKTYYYFDSCGNEHQTHKNIQEKEVVRFLNTDYGSYDYYYVLRQNGREVASGNLFDTTNWEELKVSLLKPIIYSPPKCNCKPKTNQH